MGDKGPPHALKIGFKKGDMIFSAGEEDDGLYLLDSGRLMVFVNEKDKITPLSIIGPGEYLGEFSFFDQGPKSAHVVCLEDSVVFKISLSAFRDQIPDWILTLGRHQAEKVRRANDLIAKKGIRRKKAQTVQALSISEQRKYYQILQEYKKNNNLSLDPP